jgi:ubiquinone/menaquinone biosynthesis C-methylase UbiE
MATESSHNDYFIDAENIAEMGRLMRLDEVTTESMGGLFPDHPDLSTVRRTLDVACGPGAWASELAYQYPAMEVVGIDISHIMVRFAQEQARVQRLNNVRFQVMDGTQPLDFPDKSFDLVNARFLLGFMRRQAWPVAVREMVRVAQPGGFIRLTEAENLGISTSFALETLNRLCIGAFWLSEQSFSPMPEAQHLSLTPMLEVFLREAGCQHIEQKAYAVNFSAGARAHWSTYENYKVALKLAQPYLVRMAVATQEQLDALYEQALAEMLAPDFRAVSYMLNVWGRKPLQ